MFYIFSRLHNARARQTQMLDDDGEPQLDMYIDMPGSTGMLLAVIWHPSMMHGFYKLRKLDA